MKVVVFFLLLLSSSLLKTQTLERLTEEQLEPEEKNGTITELFWRHLYPNGGWSLYCGIRFNHNGHTMDNGNIVIGQIYPSEKILKQQKCQSLHACEKKTSFRNMNRDLHNLYPVWSELIHTQRNHSFAEIEAEEWRFRGCDYEKKNLLIEPREIARGNIARAIFYMADTYQLPIDQELQDTLSKWNYDDLPSEQEMNRNNLIEKIQGNRNQYIDNPELIKKSNHTD